jgi:hypothetical protein
MSAIIYVVNSTKIFVFCLQNEFRIVLDLFSNYVFPASQDRSSMACNSQDDCGVGSDSNGIECNYIQGYENNYKVCKCKSGYFLNPADSTCGIRQVLLRNFVFFIL